MRRRLQRGALGAGWAGGPVLLVFITLVSNMAEAVERPDLSGVWKLDTLRSEFGNLPGGRPKARTDVIEHRDPRIVQTLYLERAGGRDTTVYRYTTDREPTVNRVAGQDIRATVWWQADTLRLLSKTMLMVFELSLDDSWVRSQDGTTLTMTRRVKYPLGEDRQRLVFVKTSAHDPGSDKVTGR